MKVKDVASYNQLQSFREKELENWESIIKQQYNTIIKEEIKNELKERKQQILSSIRTKDLSSFLRIYTDNSEFIFPNEYSIKGKNILKENHPGFNSVISQEYNAEQYHFLENKIVELGTYTAKFESDGTLLDYEKKYVYSWIKENNEWKIMNDFTISEDVY